MAIKKTILSPIPRSALGFRPEFLDFERGIRVGNLDDHERITRILKLELEYRYQEAFVTERWGRGVFWQWIGYLPRANRTAKPVSSSVSFGCAKFYLSVDTEDRQFECGAQIERGYIKAPADFRGCELQPDWDWHRLVRSLKSGSPMEKELRRLISKEGFQARLGNWDTAVEFHKKSLPDAVKLRRALGAAAKDRWAGFQIFYPMTAEEVHGTTGLDLVESMLAVFDEVTPAMNLCMQIRLNSQL
jgi:hypothetical protein